MPGVAYLQAYDHTGGLCNVFPSAWCRCHKYVSPL